MKFFPVKWLSLLIIITSSVFIASEPSLAEVQKNAQSTSLQPKLAELEASSGGRIGIYAVNMTNGKRHGWIVADKTGTGPAYGTTNDIGIIWPAKCAPIIVAIYYTSDDKKAVKREDIVASVTHILIDQLAQSDQCIRRNIDRFNNEITDTTL